MLEHLWQGYTAYLGRQIEKRKAEGKPALELHEALQMVTTKYFLTWATHDLDEQRVMENSPIVKPHQGSGFSRLNPT